MIQLDIRNGHNQNVITEFNNLSKHLSDTEILYHILTLWADDDDIESITYALDDLIFNDIDGNVLKVGDSVVVIDDSELIGDPPKRGDVLQVTKLVDSNSNYIECGDFGLYAHRLLKINSIK